MSAARIIVVGAGHLGTYHLEKLTQHPGASLMGVVEPDAARRDKATRRFEIPGYARLEAVDQPADAAIIAAPSTTHLELGLQALERGWDVLVEKPIADTVEAGQQLVARAAARARILQVGHTERFNPAVAAAMATSDRPRYIVSERLGPFTGRSTDVDVVLDLMIHDLDIVGHLIPAELVETRAIGVPVLTDAVDMASARLTFADGTVAQLSAGRASLEPVRKLRFFTAERYLSVDCASREVKCVRRLPPAPGSSYPQLTGEPVDVDSGDALQRQDAAFLHAVRTRAQPVVDGAAGLRALALAEAVKHALYIPLDAQQPTSG